MPAKKPAALNKRHSLKHEREARAAGEAAIAPKSQLAINPPAVLKEHPIASGIWIRLVGLYLETEGTIVTAFDEDLLIKYCLAEEELHELYELRSQIKALWLAHVKQLKRLKPTAKNLKDYFSALMQANALLQRFQGMDARMDGKRKFVFGLSQSLYLTPRSRAGVAPQAKEPEQPKDEMDKLLEEMPLPAVRVKKPSRR